jgi:hypothetical protein
MLPNRFGWPVRGKISNWHHSSGVLNFFMYEQFFTCIAVFNACDMLVRLFAKVLCYIKLQNDNDTLGSSGNANSLSLMNSELCHMELTFHKVVPKCTFSFFCYTLTFPFSFFFCHKKLICRLWSQVFKSHMRCVRSH